MNYIKTFSDFIFENLSKETNNTKICFMPGRFQPFHNGHISALKATSEKFGCPVIPLQIISKTDKSPFPEYLLKEIGLTVAKNNKFIQNFLIYPNSYGKTVIPQFVRFLRDSGYEPIGFGVGSDRVSAYKPQIKYILSDKTDTRVDKDFKLEIVDVREKDGPSGTKVRDSIQNNDFESFQEMMPDYLHSYFKELQKFIPAKNQFN